MKAFQTRRVRVDAFTHIHHNSSERARRRESSYCGALFLGVCRTARYMTD